MDKTLISEIEDELQYDLIIKDINKSLLPQLTKSQLDALAFSIHIELQERFPDEYTYS